VATAADQVTRVTRGSAGTQGFQRPVLGRPVLAVTAVLADSVGQVAAHRVLAGTVDFLPQSQGQREPVGLADILVSALAVLAGTVPLLQDPQAHPASAATVGIRPVLPDLREPADSQVTLG
jgi:hypothetical protein